MKCDAAPILNNSSSSSSASTITPSRSSPQVNGNEASESENLKPPAVSDSGDSLEEGAAGSRSLGSSAGVSTMQEVKGIPKPMDVTRL